VIARNRSLGALDHQRRDLHSIKLSYLTEDRAASTIKGAEEIPPNTNIAFERNMAKEAELLAPEAPSEYPDYIIRHASGKILSEEENFEAKHYARELKYPKGALVFNGTDEDDFLYCLLDNKDYSSAGRWPEVWVFRSSKLASVP
jgi:hypothetical protein